MIEPSAEKLLVNESTMAMVNKVGPKASIVDIRLVDHVAKVREATAESPSLMRTGHAIKIARDVEHGALRVWVSFKTDVAHDTEESRKNPPVTVTATYALAYSVEGLAGFDDDHLKAFGEVNGKFNAWPFWRELFHAAMGRMGFQPSTMPSLRVEKTQNQSSV